MEEPMEWLYATFQVPTPLEVIRSRRTRVRKRKCMDFLKVDTKQKKK